METKKKGEHLLVIYSNTGEHIMVEYDYLEENINRERVDLKRVEKDQDGNETENWVATFYRENIAGWEQLR